jgi:GMP synthase-like glutamine amidotransferase
MNIHYFQHVPYEGLGSIADWAERPGNKITATKFYEDHRLPFIDLFDMLIIMGGPMGAKDDKKFPWMTPEKKMIEHAIKKDKLVVGICLGSQLIADVLGAKVYANKEKEIGWFPIQTTMEGKTSYFSHTGDTFDVFHWHGDTFELPSGAQHLAYSRACKHQAFSLGNNVLGLQFHLEATRDSVVQYLQGGKDELVSGKYIQTYDDIMREDSQKYLASNILLAQILEQIASTRKMTV